MKNKTKYRIKTIQYTKDRVEYWVEKERPMFFFFGPMIWVDAITWDDCVPFGVPYFNTYDAARKFIEDSLYPTKVSVSEEFVEV